MKTIIHFILLFTLPTLQAAAQGIASTFQIDQQVYIQLELFLPEARLECYSTPEGGKQQEIITADEHGGFKQHYMVEEVPAFVIDRKCTEHPEGTNKVFFLDQREFIVHDFRQQVSAGIVQLTWHAQVPDGNEISFEVYKRTLNGGTQMIKRMIAMHGQSEYPYAYSEPNTVDALYQVRIMKDNAILRHVLGQSISELAADVLVYPTVCNDKLFVDLPAEMGGTSCYFQICNLAGQVLMQGTLEEHHSTLLVQHLSAGNYFITVRSADLSISKQFSKL